MSAVSAANASSHAHRSSVTGEIKVIRLEADLGAEVLGVDFAAPVTAELAERLRSLLWQHQILFFRDIGIESSKEAEVARVFGEPLAASVAKWRGEWPYAVSVLQSGIGPPPGGEAVFSSAISAYESLPDSMKKRIDGRTAIHRLGSKPRELIQDQAELKAYLADYPRVEHPVVITHPLSGRQVLYVDETFTEEIVSLPSQESSDLLAYLTHQFYRPENQLRVKLRGGVLVIWDNCAVRHYGITGPGDQPRRMARVARQWRSADALEAAAAGFHGFPSLGRYASCSSSSTNP